MSLVALLTLGFLLGMRHATDADHVVAVSTIVSQERSLRAAGPLGVATGIASVAFGAVLVYETGFVDGLFTDHPRWTPR